jgi:uncharacterized protein
MAAVMHSSSLRQVLKAHTTSSKPRIGVRRAVECRAQKGGAFETLKQNAGAAALAASLVLAPAQLAQASEFDLLAASTPSSYVIDDAAVLNKTTRKSVGDELKALQEATGYRLEVATVRKLEFESDAFAFGDKLVGKWFPDAKDKSGVLLVVTSGKDGALTGGSKFMAAVGDDLIDSIVGENIPILTDEEKYNETITSSVSRVVAKLSGKEDPGAPERNAKERRRTYKTKEETNAKKPITGTIVLTLLFISFVVPMLQYIGYTNSD